MALSKYRIIHPAGNTSDLGKMTIKEAKEVARKLDQGRGVVRLVRLTKKKGGQSISF